MGKNERKEIMETLKTVPIKEDVSQGARMGLPQTDIGSGKTVSFMDSDGSMFYVAGGTTVSFSIELDRSASVEMGYISNTGAGHRHIAEHPVRIIYHLRFQTQVITGFTLPIHLPAPYG